jgi:hypothetical protein
VARARAEAAWIGGRAAATARGLTVWAGESGQPAASGLWTDIETARWKGGVLQIEWNHGAAPSALPLGRAGRRLASVVSERVRTSMVAATSVEVDGGAVAVSIRRTAEGELFSRVIAASDIDMDAPAAAAAITRAERSLREAVGLDG